MSLYFHTKPQKEGRGGMNVDLLSFFLNLNSKSKKLKSYLNVRCFNVFV